MTIWQVFCEALKWIIGIGCAWFVLKTLWVIVCLIFDAWLS